MVDEKHTANNEVIDEHPNEEEVDGKVYVRTPYMRQRPDGMWENVVPEAEMGSGDAYGFSLEHFR